MPYYAIFLLAITVVYGQITDCSSDSGTRKLIIAD